MINNRHPLLSAMKKLLLFALTGLFLVLPALGEEKTGYAYTENTAYGSLNIKLTCQTYAYEENNPGLARPIYVVPTVLADTYTEEGLPYGALGERFLLLDGKGVSETGKYSYNPKKGLLKFKRAKVLPQFVLFDGRSYFYADTSSVKGALAPENDLSTLADAGCGFIVQDSFFNLDLLPLQFRLKGKKYVCQGDGIFPNGICKIKASFNPKKENFVISMKFKASAFSVSYGQPVTVDMKYSYDTLANTFGTIWSSPEAGNTVSLHAKPWPGSYFADYFVNGTAQGAKAETKVTLTKDSTISAIFHDYSLSVSSEGQGSVRRECVGRNKELLTLVEEGGQATGFNVNGNFVPGTAYLCTLTNDTEVVGLFNRYKLEIKRRRLGTYTCSPSGLDTYDLQADYGFNAYYVVSALSSNRYTTASLTGLVLDGDTVVTIKYNLQNQLYYDIPTKKICYGGSDVTDFSDPANCTNRIYLSAVTPSGSYQIGSFSEEVGYTKYEKMHKVELSHWYYVAQTEMTQGQLLNLIGKNYGSFEGLCRPVETISYNALRGDGWPLVGTPDPTSVIGRIRTASGLPFDIPTEAQWELACRDDMLFSLNNGTMLYCNENAVTNLADVARYSGNTHDGAQTEHCNVGRYTPRSRSIFDMHGNVYEFCRDYAGNYPESETPLLDPAGPNSGTERIRRGGSYLSEIKACRAGYRTGADPKTPFADTGFRLIVEIEK